MRKESELYLNGPFPFKKKELSHLRISYAYKNGRGYTNGDSHIYGDTTSHRISGKQKPPTIPRPLNILDDAIR